MKTGLFSAIVAAFLMESYKKLSPDSGDQTVALLTQLVSISAGAAAVVQPSPPFKVPASIVRVNVMWFLSLIFSLSCGLLATLIQQWTRRYLNYAHSRGAPRKRARIRAYMFEGIETFGLSQAAQVMPLLLHISFFLFFAGLVDFLLPINNVVAFSILGCVVGIGFIYVILSLLPNFRLNCPYRTPLSGFTHAAVQFVAISLISIAQAIEGMFHGLLPKIWRCSHPNVRGSLNDWSTKWRAILEDKVRTHSNRLSNGLRWSVELAAMEAPSNVDAVALHWTLTTLDEDREFEEFAARMPGFFDSHATSNATSAMLALMSEQPTFQSILGSRLHELLGTCLPGTSPLSERQRTYRLRVCLTSLWYCVRTYNQPENLGMPLAPYVCATFASPQMIHWIQTETDRATRLLGRCFGSLVVKKLASDITSPTRTSIASTAEIACLSNIIGTTGEQVRNWLGQEGAIGLANLISLTSGEIDTLVANGTDGLSFNVLDVFHQTLDILVAGTISGHDNVEWKTDRLPPDQVARFHEIFYKFAKARVPDLLKERLRYLSDRLPPSLSYVEEVRMEISSAEPGSEAAVMSRQIRNGNVRIGSAPDGGFD